MFKLKIKSNLILQMLPMRTSAASIAAVVEGGGGAVSLSVLRPYAAHCIKLVCMAVIPEGSFF